MEQCIKLFVPLGTQRFPFNRLVQELNRLVTEGKYGADEIIMQSSIYDVQPIFQHHNLISVDLFNKFIDSAELVITHGGVNSIISCMKRKKPIVIVPRLMEYGEHVDNHQVEIAELMKKKYGIVVVEDMRNISESIEIALNNEYRQWVSHTDELISALKGIVDKL